MPNLESTQNTYGPVDYYARPAKVAAAPGGSVIIEHLVAGDVNDVAAVWNTIHTLNGGESIELLIGNAAFRITPTGGAQYSFVGH